MKYASKTGEKEEVKYDLTLLNIFENFMSKINFTVNDRGGHRPW